MNAFFKGKSGVYALDCKMQQNEYKKTKTRAYRFTFTKTQTSIKNMG